MISNTRVSAGTVAALLAAVSAATLAPDTAEAGRYDVVSQSVIRFHGSSQARRVKPLSVPIATTPRAEPDLEPKAALPRAEAAPAEEPKAELPDMGDEMPEGEMPEVAPEVADAPDEPELIEAPRIDATALDGAGEPDAEAEKARRRELAYEKARERKRQLSEATRDVD